jgi:glycosyltransferase involved in cell wall biosynthesis
VGGGKLRGDLELAAAETAPAGSVQFLGERDDVAAILDAADVLLVTSLREGMPHVVLEAMLAGTPVVATSVAGIPEMIEDGRHGLLVPSGEPEAASRAAARILSDPALAGRLAEESERRVRQQFSLSTMLERVERCFERELSLARSRGRS